MRPRVIPFLLLATFAYWATGAARFVHERTAHGHTSQETLSAIHGPSASPAETDSHSLHEDCAVCGGLASMAAGPITAPPVLDSGRRLLGAIPVSDGQISARPFIQFPLSRGPPFKPSNLPA